MEKKIKRATKIFVWQSSAYGTSSKKGPSKGGHRSRRRLDKVLIEEYLT